MKQLNVKTLIKNVPEAKDFGLSGAVLFNGQLHTVSDYDLPNDVFEKLEKFANNC